MTSPHDESSVLELQDLIIDTASVGEFLEELTVYASRAISNSIDEPVACAITLRRRNRSATIAGSSPNAREVNEIQHLLGSGPCLEALETNTAVLLDDVSTETRWPEYRQALAEHGIHSVLGLPLELGKDSWAALNIYSRTAGLFDPRTVTVAEGFAKTAGHALRLAVRIGTEQLLAEDLRAAMVNRTTIDLVCGAIMAQNRCSQKEAFAILTRASNDRNMKLHLVAEEILLRISGSGGQSHFAP